MYYHSGPEWTWERWQWRGTPHSPKLQHYWNFTIRLLSVISWTLVGGVLPLFRKQLSFSKASGKTIINIKWTKNYTNVIIIDINIFAFSDLHHQDLILIREQQNKKYCKIIEIFCRYIRHYHHYHHVAPPAQISLTHYRHSSRSSIARSRFSRLCPVLAQSCCI